MVCKITRKFEGESPFNKQFIEWKEGLLGSDQTQVTKALKFKRISIVSPGPKQGAEQKTRLARG